jgi:hypothetical protein
MIIRRTRRQGLGELVGLLGVGDAEGVQVARAADLELDNAVSLLDLDGARVLSAGLLEEVPDVRDLLGPARK